MSEHDDAEEGMLTAAVEQVVVELPEDFSWPRPLSLTSRKMTGPLVKAIATAMGLPNTGSKEETLQMVEGRLQEKGYDSPNVQVSITDSEEDSSVLCLQLIAAPGVFLQVGLKKAEEIGTEESEESETEVEGREPGDEAEREAVFLAQELELSKEEVSRLTETVDSLNDNVLRLNVRVNELWQTNCSFAREFETAVAEKDDEIIELKRQLASARTPRPESVIRTPLRPSVISTPLRSGASIFVAEHDSPRTEHDRPVAPRRGKAPPVDSFSGEDEV